MYPRWESNPNLKFRKLPFYPLNYKGKQVFNLFGREDTAFLRCGQFLFYVHPLPVEIQNGGVFPEELQTQRPFGQDTLEERRNHYQRIRKLHAAYSAFISQHVSSANIKKGGHQDRLFLFVNFTAWERGRVARHRHRRVLLLR